MSAIKNLNREKIRALFKEGYCLQEIARKFNCRSNAIIHHVYDLTIPHVSRIKNNMHKLKARQVKSIRKLYIEEKLSAPTIATKFKVSASTILNIVHGVFYRWVPGEIIDKEGQIYEIPEGFTIDMFTNKKGAMKTGPNENSERYVRPGELLPIAKKFDVSISTVSKWIRKGKISRKGKLL